MSHPLKTWTQHYEETQQEQIQEHHNHMQTLPEKQKKKNPENKIYQAMDNFVNIKEMAREFIKVQPLHYDKNQMWWMWNWKQKKWHMIDQTDIMIRLDKASQERIGTINPTQKSMVIESLKRVARNNKPKTAPKQWIQFKDSIIDLKENKIKRRMPNHKYFITNTIPWRIGKTTKTPTIDKIFKEWVGENHVKTLHQLISYCMLPNYPLNRIFCLNGSGMNGKSKYLELLTKFLGEDNVVSTELDLIMSNRFEVAKLHKKLACLMGETNWNEMKKTALLKRLSGGDMVRFEFKNKQPFDDYNYSKIIIATNSLPMTQDKTTGFYRRWMIIDFPNTFTEKKDVLKEIPMREYENLARKSIEYLKELLDERSFHNEGTLEERRKRYEDTSNPLQRFIREEYVEDRDSFVFKWKFIKRFNDWQAEHGYREWSKTQIGKEMNKEFETGKRLDEESGNWWRAWIGLSSSGNRGLNDFSAVSAVSGVVDLVALYRTLSITSAETAETAEVLGKKGGFTVEELHNSLPLEVDEKAELVIDEWLKKACEQGDLLKRTGNTYEILK